MGIFVIHLSLLTLLLPYAAVTVEWSTLPPHLTTTTTSTTTATESPPSSPSLETIQPLESSSPSSSPLPGSSPSSPQPSSPRPELFFLSPVPTSYPAFLYTTVRSLCPESDQIHCGNSDRCIRIRYICDGDNDCGDNTDEELSLCRIWMNSDCDRNLARCSRYGAPGDCVTIKNYCTLTDPPCEGTLDRRLCVMLSTGKIQPLHEITLPTTTPETTTSITTHIPIHVLEEMWNDDFEEKLTKTISHPDCPQLYTRVGNLCMSVFFIGNMTWLESRAFCRAIGGDLFTLGKDLAPFSVLLQHLTKNGVTADFWIGGRFVNETTGWTWLDDSPITMGSPFWAARYKEDCSTRLIPYLNQTRPANDGACYHYEQSPPPYSTRQCVAATYQHYYYLTDENCFTKKSPLCVIPGEKKQQAH